MKGGEIGFALRTAVEALAHNKLRAALTSLGILFGVASVISMLAIGKGAEQEILEQMKLLGSNNVMIKPHEVQKEESTKDAATGEGKEVRKFTPGLTYADAHSILASVPHVETASAEIVLTTTFTREGRRRTGAVVGVDTPYFRLNNLSLAQGAFFSGTQIVEGRPVAVIGNAVRTRFFTTDEPLGKTIKVGNTWVTVVGVLADRHVSGHTIEALGVRDVNADIYIPATTMLRRFRNRALLTQRDVAMAQEGGSYSSDNEDPAKRAERNNANQLDRIILRVDESKYVTPVADVVRRMLTRRHNAVVDFEVTVPELLLKQEQRTKTIFNIVLGAIASISLIVGGIGIMNIMLASVLERIREIGVRRATGATQQHILNQFLTEAVLLSLAGGLAGVLLGAAFSVGIERMAGIKTIVSSLSVVVAFGVSATVGLLFGIVPAYRAARQNPIDCLRYE